jgi:hypothetical protein
VGLAHGHQQRVELVEQRRIRGQVRLEERSRLLVAGAGRQQAVAREHAPGVGVRDEDGATGGVQQDRVDRFRPQAGHAEQLTAQRPERRPPHAPEVAAEADKEPAREVEQPAGLQPVGPGRANELGHRRVIARGEPTRRQHAARAQRVHGASCAGPGRVLREDRADGDLEGRSRRPPALRSVPGQQPAVETQEARLDPVARRSGNRTPRAQHGTA